MVSDFVFMLQICIQPCGCLKFGQRKTNHGVNNLMVKPSFWEKVLLWPPRWGFDTPRKRSNSPFLIVLEAILV